MRQVLVNKASVVTDQQVAAWAAAINKQIADHVAPQYGVGSEVVFATKDTKLDPNDWEVDVVDTADIAGALGYHDFANGRPVGFVFAKTTLDNGQDPCVTASHELLEQYGNPFVDRLVLADPTWQNHLLAYELGDPVEDDQGYVIDGLNMSNFVFPNYFDIDRVGPYDYLGRLTAPFTLTPGGYILLGDYQGNFTQLTARTALGGIHVFPHPVYSRRAKYANRSGGQFHVVIEVD